MAVSRVVKEGDIEKFGFTFLRAVSKISSADVKQVCVCVCVCVCVYNKGYSIIQYTQVPM